MLCFFCFWAMSFPAWASAPPWAKREYPYVVVDQGVRDILQEFSRNLAVPVEMDDQVEGRVRGRVQADNALDFLNEVCRSSGLAWFYDRGVIYVASQGNLQARIFDLSGYDISQFMQRLNELEVGRLLTADRTEDQLSVSGPRQWIARVAELKKTLQPSRGVAPSAATVRVFRGSVEVEENTSSEGSDGS